MPSFTMGDFADPCSTVETTVCRTVLKAHCIVVFANVVTFVVLGGIFVGKFPGRNTRYTGVNLKIKKKLVILYCKVELSFMQAISLNDTFVTKRVTKAALKMLIVMFCISSYA